MAEKAEKNIRQHQTKLSAAILLKANRFRNITSPRVHIEERDALSGKDVKRYEHYPICGSAVSQLKQYGLGVLLYFKLIKRLMILFSILSVFAIWPMLVCFTSGDLTTVTVSGMLFEKFALGNIDYQAHERVEAIGGTIATVLPPLASLSSNSGLRDAALRSILLLDTAAIAATVNTTVTAASATTAIAEVTSLFGSDAVRSTFDLSKEEIALSFSFLDLAATLVIVAFMFWSSKSNHADFREYTTKETTIRHYTVQVRTIALTPSMRTIALTPSMRAIARTAVCHSLAFAPKYSLLFFLPFFFRIFVPFFLSSFLPCRSAACRPNATACVRCASSSQSGSDPSSTSRLLATTMTSLHCIGAAAN
jgi:hypothetical protein